MDNSHKHSRSRLSYSEVLQSPTKTKATSMAHAGAQTPQVQCGEQVTVSFLTPSIKIMGNSGMHLASKPSYSTIAGNSPIKEKAPTTSTQRTLFRAPMSARFFSSAKPHFPRAQLKKNYPPLEWPTKEPKPPSYDWDPNYMAAGAAKYAEEKAKNERAKLAATTGNGLISAVDSHQKNVAFRKWAKEKTQLKTQNRVSGLHEVVKTAARDGAAKYGSGRLPIAPANTRIEDFMVGRRIQTTTTYKKLSAKPITTKPNYVSKPTIPFNRSSYSDCSNWLIGFDDIPKDEQGKLKLPEETYIRVLPGNDERAADSEETDSVITEIHVGPQGLNKSFNNNGNYRGQNYGSDTAPKTRNDLETQDGQHPSKLTVLYYATPLDIKASLEKIVPRQLYYPRDNISYTQTKTWISPEENERVRFLKIQANVRHAGFHNSPFIPKTFDEYLMHKQLHAISQKQHIHGNMQQKEKTKEAAHQRLREGGDPELAMPVSITFPHWLTHLEKEDGVTAIMSRASIWTTNCLLQAEIDWPDCVEYKTQYGRKANARQGDYFPPPRSLVLDMDHQHRLRGQNPLPPRGQGVPWNKRKIANFARWPVYDMAFEAECKGLAGKPDEVELKELSQVNPAAAEFIVDTEPDNNGDE